MNPWFILPLTAGLACLVFGVLVWTRDPDSTAHRCAAALLLGGFWWGLCEALWTLAPDPVTALRLVRLSALGWVFTGPVCVHMFLAQLRSPPPWARPALLGCYAVSIAALGVEWGTPWMHTSVYPVPWGWAYRPGPAYASWYLFNLVAASVGIGSAVLELWSTGSPAESQQSPWLIAGMAVPLVVGSGTDGLLPLLGVTAPRLGVASFAVLGVVIAISIQRYGYSLIAPGSFASRILDSMPEGVALVAPDGRVRLANPKLAALLGRPVATLLDTPARTLIPGVPLEVEQPLRGHECELTDAGGSRIPVALSASPLRDKQGAVLGLVLVVQDLREVATLRARLLTSARLAAVGELAAGIAHEINNPLAYIGSNLRALHEQWRALAEAWRKGAAETDLVEIFEDGLAMVEESLEGVERTAAIVRDVRSFSHGGDGSRERLDPNELIERALRMAEPHLRARARVTRELGEVPLVEGTRRELEQVVLNLLINAAHALGGGGTVRVRTHSSAGEVEIAVADDGCGIAPALLDRIFDPFFTTKPVGEGTGLGLSISHEIVRRHGGRIEVSSEPGVGTEFRVALPVAEL